MGAHGAGSQAQASKHRGGPATRPLTSLRTHRLALFPISAFFLRSFPLLAPCTSLSLHTLFLSLPLSRSFSLVSYVLLAFIIKIKCKIVPRTSFPNGIKLRALVSFFLSFFLSSFLCLYYHYTRGRIGPSFSDRVIPPRPVEPSRAIERAVSCRFILLLLFIWIRRKVLRVEAIRHLMIPEARSEPRFTYLVSE